MHRFAPVALATLLAATAPARAQAQNGTHPRAQAPTPFTVPAATSHFTDPANLAGERVQPRNGRELPIDGGIGPDGKPDNALGLAQMLRKLSTRASLMLIVAHPDDEDGGMLTYYSRGLGARVAVLTLTRGEGGQNQATGDFEDALGLLRTQELLSADRYMGVDQFFGTEVDFGFTKTKAEAFQKWNHERVLYDAVRAVRIYRPLVIAAVFSGAVTDGHGQHQVSGQIAQEVFKAAGDPNVFPELTREGILPWQPVKVFARVPFSRVTDKGLYDYATGQTVPAEFTNYVTGQKFTTAPTPDVTINEGATDPLLTYAAADFSDLRTKPENLNEPLSYVQFARIGLGLQRSQIGAGMRLPRPGRADVSYHLYGSRVCAPNPTPNLCSTATALTDNRSDTPGAPSSARQSRDRVGYRAAREKKPSAHLEPTSFTATPSDNPALTNQPSFFDGIDISIEGVAALAPHSPASLRSALHSIASSFEQAQAHFDAQQPEAIAPFLEDADTKIGRLMGSIPETPLPASVTVPSELRAWDSVPVAEKVAINHELRIKKSQLADALALSLGIQVDATTQAAQVEAGSSAPVHIHVTTTSDQPLTVFSVELGGRYASAADHANHTLSPKSPLDLTLTEGASQTSKATRPYFTRTSIEDPVYKLLDPSLRNAPASPWPLGVTVFVTHRDHMIVLGRVVHSGPQPVQIIPPVSLTLDRNAQVVPTGTHSLNIDVHIESEDHPTGYIGLRGAPKDWVVRSPFRPLRASMESFPVSLPANPLTATATVEAAAIVYKTTYTEGFRPIGYGTLPRTNFYTPATLRIVPVDLKLPPEDKRRIAYLPGTGDDVPAALASIGLTPTILKVSDLTPTNLAKFDTVVLGVRTYNAHPDLHGAPTQALLDFARNGGNVVVQYQTPEFTAADAPYSLTDRNERVIDETAPVQILDPNSPLLTTPNKITSADFNNWIEERGHGFLDTWDPHYTALTETHDPGAPAEHILPQAPQRGGLITTQLGKGRWTYCAFALYRQLPEAVPGAFRLFVNLLNP